MQVSDSKPIISVNNVSKAFSKKTVVRDLSFEVAPGRIFGLVGPSGCGKTTTIRLLTGVYRPTKGSIQVLGRAPISFGRLDREQIGYLPQHFVLYKELSVTENLGLVAGLYGLVRRREQRIREVLEFVELWDARETLAGDLSGGMQRRLGLAAALVHEPSLVFVDEPTAGIDPVLRAKFWDGFRDLRDTGHTIFLTTQYVTEVDYCDEVVVLREGSLVVLGTPSEIRRQVMGGDAIELDSEGLTPERLASLKQIPGLHELTVVSPEQAILIVDDGPSTLPEVQRSVEGLGLTVKRLGLRQANFDEVFVRLMEQASDGDWQPEGNGNATNGPGKSGRLSGSSDAARADGGPNDA